MNLRYYGIFVAVVLGLTFVISWLKQTRTRKEFFMILVGVVLGLVALGLAIVGLSKLLVALGIAKAGFIF